MEAIELLKGDHDVLRDLFWRYPEAESAQPSEKVSVLGRVRAELEAHCQIEEDLFYPAIFSAGPADAERLVREDFEEYRIAKQLLRELASGLPESEAFDAKFKLLREIVLHQAQVEERELFELAREYLPVEELHRLGREMADRKHLLGGQVHRPPAVVRRTRRLVSRVRRGVSRLARRSAASPSGASRRRAEK